MVPQLNPAYQHWVQQDQAILSAFVSLMTESVVCMVMFASSPREAWETLAGAFAATSFARSSSLRQQLAEMKKRDMSVTVYFTKMKALADELMSIGQPLQDSELISYILAGLPQEYDALYEVVNLRTTPMPIRDLYAQLQATDTARTPAVRISITIRRPITPRRLSLERQHMLPMELRVVAVFARLTALRRVHLHRHLTSKRRRLLLLVTRKQVDALPLCVSYVASLAIEKGN
jgi:hypothetical protein